MGVLGFEPRTSALSELRSSQLSYTPAVFRFVPKTNEPNHSGSALSHPRRGTIEPLLLCPNPGDDEADIGHGLVSNRPLSISSGNYRPTPAGVNAVVVSYCRAGSFSDGIRRSRR